MTERERIEDEIWVPLMGPDWRRWQRRRDILMFMAVLLPSLFAALVVLLALLYTTPAAADPFAPNSEYSVEWTILDNGWGVYVDKDMGYGCFAMTGYAATRTESEKGLRFGINPRYNTAYIMLVGQDWSSLSRGQDYQLSIQFDRFEPWQVVATGIWDTNTALYASVSAEFLGELYRSHGMTVHYRGREVANLGLDGSAHASEEMLRCQEAMVAVGAAQ